MLIDKRVPRKTKLFKTSFKMAVVSDNYLKRKSGQDGRILVRISDKLLSAIKLEELRKIKVKIKSKSEVVSLY